MFNGFVVARDFTVVAERVLIAGLRVVEVRVAVLVFDTRAVTFLAGVAVVVRDFKFCVCCVDVRLVTRCWVVFVAVLAFFCCGVSDFVSDAMERFADDFAETVVDCVRLVAARATSELSANVVWDTDKPRHTAKNSIILFIPFNIC